MFSYLMEQLGGGGHLNNAATQMRSHSTARCSLTN